MYRDYEQKEDVIEAKKSLVNIFIELDKYELGSVEYQALWSKISSVEKELELIKYTE